MAFEYLNAMALRMNTSRTPCEEPAIMVLPHKNKLIAVKSAGMSLFDPMPKMAPKPMRNCTKLQCAPNHAAPTGANGPDAPFNPSDLNIAAVPRPPSSGTPAYALDVAAPYAPSRSKNVFNPLTDVSIVAVAFAFPSTFKFTSVVNGFPIFGKLGSLDFGLERVLRADFFELDLFEGARRAPAMVASLVVELIPTRECQFAS